MEMDTVLKEPVGTYLNERIASDERFKDSEAVTLGSLFRIWENENENLWIPYINCAEDKMILEKYYLMQGRMGDGQSGPGNGRTGFDLRAEDEKLQHFT